MAGGDAGQPRRPPTHRTRQLPKAARTWQQHLDTRLAGPDTPAVQEWGPVIAQAGSAARLDTFLPVLAERLAAISRSGINAAQLLDTAINTGPLPDEHGAAALWWRISRHLQPAVTAAGGEDPPLTTPWTRPAGRIGRRDLADRLHHSPMWPALVSAVDHALQRGWPLEQLLTATATPPADDDCQALVWRISVLTDPAPDQDQADVLLADPGADIDPQRGQQIGRSTDRGCRAAAPQHRVRRKHWSLTMVIPPWSVTRIVGLRPTWPWRRWSAAPVSDSSRPTWR